LQGFTFVKESKEKLSASKVEEVSEQPALEESGEMVIMREEEIKSEVTSGTFLGSFKETKKNFRESVAIRGRNIEGSLIHGVGESKE